MRKPTSRETVYLVALAAVVIGYLYFQGGDAFTGGADSKEDDELKPGVAPVVDLARLAMAPDEYDVNGRNLFQWGSPPRKDPPPRVVPPKPKPKPAPVRQGPVRKPTPRRDPPKPQKRQPPRPDFDYLGYLGPKENRIAVFEEKRRDEEEDPMILARAGQVVQKDFRVVEFKYETIVLGYTDSEFEGQTTELQIKKK